MISPVPKSQKPDRKPLPDTEFKKGGKVKRPLKKRTKK